MVQLLSRHSEKNTTIDIMFPSSTTSIEQALSLLELEHDDDTEAPPDRCCASSAGSSSEVCSLLDHSSNSLCKHKQSVSFSTVQVREYAVIIGDHPCCQSGVPLALDWTVVAQRPAVSLDAHERRRQRRHRGELVRSWEERQALYLEDTPDVRRQTRTRQRQRCRAQQQDHSRAFFASSSPL